MWLCSLSVISKSIINNVVIIDVIISNNTSWVDSVA